MATKKQLERTVRLALSRVETLESEVSEANADHASANNEAVLLRGRLEAEQSAHKQTRTQAMQMIATLLGWME